MQRVQESRTGIEGVPGELIAAATEVDPSLLQWSRSLSVRERLRAATRAHRALAGFRRAPSERG